MSELTEWFAVERGRPVITSCRVARFGPESRETTLEFAGACVSHDGSTLFVNLFGDGDAPGSGMTCAITGPWRTATTLPDAGPATLPGTRAQGASERPASGAATSAGRESPPGAELAVEQR